MKFRLLSSCLALLLFSWTVAPLAAGKAEATSAAPTKIFVLAGQSNMLGRGFPLSQGEASNINLLVWRGKVGWQIAKDPLGDPQDKENGIGPGMTFGHRVVQTDPGQTIGLVMCAKSGSSISEWQPNQSLYKKCIEAVKATGVPVAGVLFLQGESDAINKNTAKQWEARFINVLKTFRSDLGGQFLLGQIGSINLKVYKFQQVVRDQQAQAAKDFNLLLIVTSDLAVGSDKVHFTVDSYKIIGQRFATADGY